MTVKLPGGSQEVSGRRIDLYLALLGSGAAQVIVSSHNSLGDGRYYDVESQSSFAFDQITQVGISRDGFYDRLIDIRKHQILKHTYSSLSTRTWCMLPEMNT